MGVFYICDLEHTIWGQRGLLSASILRHADDEYSWRIVGYIYRPDTQDPLLPNVLMFEV